MWDLVDDLDLDGIGFDPGGEGMSQTPVQTSNYYDPQTGYSTDPNTGDVWQGSGENPNAPGGFTGGNTNEGFYGYSVLDRPEIFDYIKRIQKAKELYSALHGGATPGASNGRGILGGIADDPIGALFNSAPFLLAMAQANKQENQTSPILARLSGLSDEAAGNQAGLVSSVTGPYNRQTMAGRDELLTDQSLRGIRGSSFGDQTLTSYDTARGQGLGELTGSTLAKSIGLRGDLLNKSLVGQTNAATSRNLLIGAGLSASGNLFKPNNDPFDLAKLIGGFT